MKNIILFGLITFTLLSLTLVSAETEIVKQYRSTELKFTCTLNHAIPSASATYNLTISYPNGSTFINNKQATALGNGAFNYTTIFTELGNYKIQMFCTDNTYSFSNEGYYIVTPTGYQLDTSKSIVIFIGLGIMLLIGVLFFIFGIYAKGITKIFSIGLSILLIAFSFGYTINILNAGIAEYTGLINGFDSLYLLITVLLTIGGIGLVLFLIYASVQYFNKLRGFKD